MSNNIIEFSIPGFYSKEKENLIFFDYYYANRDHFYDDIKISSCYGCFPCIWNGGRRIVGDVDDTYIGQTVLYYNQKGISLRFTFTNNQLKEEHLKDEKCNHILELTRMYGLIENGITVASPILKDYLTNNYPDFYQVLSTTLAKNNIEEINRLSKNNLIVPYYGLNNDFDRLSQLENKDNIEILLGDLCVDNCPYRDEHYKTISKSQLYNYDIYFQCPHRGKVYKCYVDTMKTKHYVTIDDIRNKYLPLGINKFKIAGRQDTYVDLFEKYVNYFAKPEYRDRVRNMLLNEYVMSN